MAAWYSYNMLRGFLWSLQNLIGHSGYDFAAPCGTSITAPVSGTIVTSGEYPWGGQLDLQPDSSDQIPGYTDNIILTWLHSSREDVSAGQHVDAGQQLGLSGQPPPGGRFGSGCHIHFEITNGSKPPYSRDYNPEQPTKDSYPLNPVPFIAWLNGHPQDPTLPVQGSTRSDNPIAALAQGIAPVGRFFGAIGGLTPWLTSPLRIVKLFSGVAFVMFGLFVAVWPEAAGVTAGVAATVATGDPVAGAAFGSKIRSAGRGGTTKSGPQRVVQTAGEFTQLQTKKKSAAQAQQAQQRGVESGVVAGIKRQQDIQHQRASAAARKGAQTRAANKAAGAQGAKPAKQPASAPAEKEEVAYIGGKRVGVMRGGKLIPDVKQPEQQSKQSGEQDFGRSLAREMREGPKTIDEAMKRLREPPKKS